MSEENFKKFLGQLGDKLSLKGLSADEDNYCCLGFDDKIIIHLQYNKEADVIMLFAQLGTVLESQQSEIYPKILKANLFWQGTGGATIGLDDETGEILMSYQTPMSLLDFDKFSDLIEGFINTAEVWIRTLEALQGGTSEGKELSNVHD